MKITAKIHSRIHIDYLHIKLYYPSAMNIYTHLKRSLFGAFILMFLGGCAQLSLSPKTDGNETPARIPGTGTFAEKSSRSEQKNKNGNPTKTTEISEEIRSADDFWFRLRNSFVLEYKDASDPMIGQFEQLYATPKYFERLAGRAYWFMPYVLNQAEKRGMPAEVALLPVMESAYRPDAVSKSNAVGMWQFISATGKHYGLRQDGWMDARKDLVQSTGAALDYLAYLSDEFDGDWELAFAAYNAGEGTVGRAIAKNKKANKPTNFTDLNLRQETREYVPKLFALKNIFTNPGKYGITLNPIPNKEMLTIVDLGSQTDLSVIASLIPVSQSRFSFFNKDHKRGVTPPDGPHTIAIPVEHEHQLREALSKLSQRQRLRWARHEVKKGDYLGRIARKHSVSVGAIMHANHLTSNLIKPGQVLKIPLSTGNIKYTTSTLSGTLPGTQTGNTLYTVRAGDSLWRIAKQSGIPLSTILRWNNINKNMPLYPGQKLIVGRSS